MFLQGGAFVFILSLFQAAAYGRSEESNELLATVEKAAV